MVVAVLASLSYAALFGALLGFALLVNTVVSPDVGALMMLPTVVAAFFAVGGVVASFLAAFTASLEGPPRFGIVMKRALLGGPAVVGVAMLAVVPLGLTAAGIALVVAPLRHPNEASVLTTLVGLAVALVGAWMFGRYVLLTAVEYFRDAGDGIVVVSRLDQQVPGHEAVVLVTGAAPVLGILAVIGHAFRPTVSVPSTMEPVVVLAASSVILILTLAVATAAYAVIDAPR